MLYVGDSMCCFRVGDLCFIGFNFLYLFWNDFKYYEYEVEYVEVILIFFDWKSFGVGFFEILELRVVSGLLWEVNKGIYFFLGMLGFDLSVLF